MRRGQGRAVLVGAALVASVSATACGKELDVSKPEEAIAREVERVYGVEVEGVSCPRDVQVREGATFDCLVVLPGDRLTANVTQTDDEGGLSFELAEQILTRRSVTDAIRKQYNATSVDCGEDRFWVSRPGRSFTCQATDDAGGDAEIEVTIRDRRGNIDLDFAS
jgi:hypothetical protein